MNAMQKMTEGMIKENQPKFEVGDTVRVSVRIKEGDKERIQAFEGTVIAKKHGGIAETFTVRRTSYGVGVERVFPVNSPFVENVEVVRRGKVRRAKLFYLRSRTGKAAKVKARVIGQYAAKGEDGWRSSLFVLSISMPGKGGLIGYGRCRCNRALQKEQKPAGMAGFHHSGGCCAFSCVHLCRTGHPCGRAFHGSHPA